MDPTPPPPTPSLPPSVAIFDALSYEFPDYVPLSFREYVKNDIEDVGEGAVKTHYLEAGTALFRAPSYGGLTDAELATIDAARAIINNKLAQQTSFSSAYLAANNLRFPA